MVKPSRRREMAQQAVTERGLSIRLVCVAFSISETCYRYQPLLSDENAEIAHWLVRLTYNQKDWGFGLCRDYLRNVKRFDWNHKRIRRIYCELELNVRIKLKRRIEREKHSR
jgi:putative transposase